MSVNIGVVDETTFKQFARRVHKALRQSDPAHPLPLGHIQEAVIQALGHRSLHDARQHWRHGQTAPVPVSVSPKEPFLECPPRPEWSDLPALIRADRTAHLHRSWKEEREKFERVTDEEDLRPGEVIRSRPIQARSPVNTALTKVGSVPPLWKEALTAITRGEEAFLAWAGSHASQLSRMVGLNEQQTVVSLVELLLEKPTGFSFYTRLMEEAERQGWPLVPLVAHFKHYLRHHKKWQQQEEWFWFADHLHEALLEPACTMMWFYSGDTSGSSHTDYRDPPHEWASHRPWRFVARALERHAVAVHLNGWLPGAWRLAREDWEGVGFWVQEQKEQTHWGSYESTTMQHIMFHASRLHKVNVLRQTLALPAFRFYRKSGDDYVLSWRQVPRWITMGQKSPVVVASLVTYYRQYASETDMVEALKRLLLQGSVSAFEAWLTALHTTAWHPSPDALKGWLESVLRHRFRTPPDRTEALSILKKWARMVPTPQVWETLIAHQFWWLCKDDQSSFLPQSSNGKELEVNLAFLLQEGAQWQEVDLESEQTAMGTFLAARNFGVGWARMAKRLGADVLQPCFGPRTLQEEMVRREKSMADGGWKALGIKAPRVAKDLDWIKQQLNQPQWALDEQAGSPLTAQVFVTACQRRRLSAEQLKQAWAHVRALSQIEVMAKLVGDLPTTGDMAQWLHRPPLLLDGKGEFIEERDPHQEEENQIQTVPDHHARLEQGLHWFKKAHTLGVDIRAPYGPHQETLLHAVCRQPDPTRKAVEALIDWLVDQGVDPWTQDKNGLHADDWPRSQDEVYDMYLRVSPENQPYDATVRRLVAHQKAWKIARAYA